MAKKPNNKYQNKLIVLISTLYCMNFKFKQYKQSDILCYFNNNFKRNGQNLIKLKTLQHYLYKLNKIFKVTINYYRHLVKNFGMTIYYKLRYSNRKCHYKHNKYFKDKKEDKYQQLANAYYKRTCIKNGHVEKWKCYYNIHNIHINKEEKKHNKDIEILQVDKYTKKYNFKSKTCLSILDLKINKDNMIKILKIIKRTENFVENNRYKKNNDIRFNKDKIANKQKEFNKILNATWTGLANEGYNNRQLQTHIQNIYKQYKHKPHFIIKNSKYSDLKSIIVNLKKTVKKIKTNTKDNTENIIFNVFSMLLDQLNHIVDIKLLVPILKSYLGKQDILEYNKVFNNHYYYEILTLIENKKNYLKSKELEKITI